MEDRLLVIADQTFAEEAPDVLEALKSNSIQTIHKQSVTAVETYEIVMTALQFFVALASIPAFALYLERKKLKISFHGFILNGSVEEILDAICQSKSIRRCFIDAYDKDLVTYKGQAGRVSELINRLMERQIVQDCKDE